MFRRTCMGIMGIFAAACAPIMNDISTDLVDPPRFEAPAGAERHGDYRASNAAKQREGYPDLAPLDVTAPPARAFGIALEAAKAMGWALVAVEPERGRIEAVDTTAVFRFKDDIVVRLRPEGLGTRLDVRSASRVGKGDLGKNAARIREYFAAVKRLLR